MVPREKQEKFLTKLFLRTKPVRMLVTLRDGPKYATVISKAVDCTYSHTVKLLETFHDFGIVDFERKGRIKIIKLTDLGEDVAKGVDAVLIKLSRLKEKA